MKYTILGSGDSNGVPQIACKCYVCASGNPKNNRTRASLLVESQKTKLLVDTSPDLRMQAIENNINYIDAVLYTHAHADHIIGIDDVKKLNKNKTPLSAYMTEDTSKILKTTFPHVFFKTGKFYDPILSINLFSSRFKVNDIEVIPFRQKHGEIYTQGFRFGDLAYSTDVNHLDPEMILALKGIKIWIVDCLRYYYAPTHSYLEKTLHWISKIKPKTAILTHMAHEIDYDEIKYILPKNVIPAYDGMIINL